MFTSFFYLLRARGLKVSLNEWMSLIEALDKGLHHSSFTGFYYLCRAILVKSEADFDKFDGAFLEYFKDMERATDELPKELLDWLNKPREELDGSFSEEDLLRNLGLSEQQIQQMFLERLQEQHEQHNGGSKWIGTRGASPFGNNGQIDKGIRVGGKSQKRSAFQVAGERKFRDFREDNVLDTRQFQMHSAACASFPPVRMRQEPNLMWTAPFAKPATTPAGNLKVVYDKPEEIPSRYSFSWTAAALWIITAMCSALFQAVRNSNHFKDLQVFYFHNCIYSKIFKDPRMRPNSAIPTEWILQNISSEYKVIIVGDAQMDPYELMEGSWYSYGSRDRTPGIEWLKRFKEKYPHIVWLNPSERPYWGGWWAKTYDILAKEFDMYRLTLDDLNNALKKLMVNR